jgi:RNase P/RNase MRP subunit p29
VQHERDAGLHVENAGAAEASVFDFAGHVRQSAQGINGIVVAEEQDRLAICLAGEVDLQTVAKVVAAVESSSSAKHFELGREECGDVVDRWFVVAGGLNLDEFANRVNDSVLMFREAAQAVVPRVLVGGR